MKKSAYTLAEVVLVMIIVAVVAGINLKTTKTKLDSIVSIQYYTSYSTLDTVVSEMMHDFDKKSDGVYLKNGLSTPPSTLSCSEDQEWNAADNSCKSYIETLPRKGQNFCEKFEFYVNSSDILGQKISGWSGICKGSLISDTTTNFKTEVPDMVLRNGIRLYNLSKEDPKEFSELKTTETSGMKNYTNVSGSTIYMPQSGYKVYVDLDGEKGESLLWYDVYPFFITMDGKVIPAYDGETGANSTFHLQVNGYDTYMDAAGQVKDKSLFSHESYKSAACKIGEVDSAASYCSGVPVIDDCKLPEHNCYIKIVKRIRLSKY